MNLISGTHHSSEMGITFLFACDSFKFGVFPLMKIFYHTFYVPLYIPPITISHVLDCVRFFSILNISFFIRKGKKKKTLGKLWLVKYKVKHKIVYTSFSFLFFFQISFYHHLLRTFSRRFISYWRNHLKILEATICWIKILIRKRVWCCMIGIILVLTPTIQ